MLICYPCVDAQRGRSGGCLSGGLVYFWWECVIGFIERTLNGLREPSICKAAKCFSLSSHRHACFRSSQIGSMDHRGFLGHLWVFFEEENDNISLISSVRRKAHLKVLIKSVRFYSFAVKPLGALWPEHKYSAFLPKKDFRQH